MLLQREGLPEEGEIVLCTVTKIYHHSVFVTLDEFGGKSGMIHISEISPGRIRNIRDFVVEGKKVTCKVLKIDQEKGHIDLSLRRVNEAQKRMKNNEIKQEQKAEKIVEFIAKELKLDTRKLYNQIKEAAFKKYDFLFETFADVVAGNYDLEKLNLDKKTTEKLEEVIRQRIKPPEVSIGGTISLVSHEPDGVDVIKEILKKALSKGKDMTEIKFIGAGKYSLKVKAEEYKQAEKILSNILKCIETSAKNRAEFTFQRKQEK
ncbi:translation initiation factor IF-2 subunit alpha [Candidatus Woesearchaeota archaeon]|nr:translation initiation factor IF-2 subunit alpha [Candidatus Woesearchaeota archaeon]